MSKKTLPGIVEYRLEGDLDMRALMTRDDDGDATREFEGLACPYGAKDTYGTTFMRGCFNAYKPLAGELFPLLDMHDRGKVLGVFKAWEEEDGLWIAGAFDDTQAGRDAHTQALSGSKPNLSVGFRWMPTAAQIAGDDDVDLIRVAELKETSLITRGMQSVPGAGMTAVRVEGELAPVPEVAAERAIETLNETDPNTRARFELEIARAWAV